MKTYNIRYNIGKTKYVVNYHDGIKVYPDGSQFFDIAIFKRERQLHLFLNNLKEKGYRHKG